MTAPLCPKCEERPRRPRNSQSRKYQGYCVECGREVCREYRKNHPEKEQAYLKTGEQRRLRRIRVNANHAVYRGKIQRQPCQICGAHAQMHHPDYDKPFEVEWYCAEHHRKLHRQEPAYQSS